VNEFLTRQQVADLLLVPEKTLATWAYMGTGPGFYKVGRHARYRRVDLEQWLRAHRRHPARVE